MAVERLVLALEMIAGQKEGMGSEPEEQWYRDLAAAALNGDDLERFADIDPYEYWKRENG